MKLKNLLLSIGIVIVGLWLLGIILKIAGWLLHIFLVIGAVLIISALLGKFFEDRKKR